jgi:hypothetical protein
MEAPLGELAEILAAGLVRALAPKSSPKSADSGESSLHILDDQSGDPTTHNGRMSDG